MPVKHESIQLGSAHATAFSTPAALVTEVLFPPNFVLEPHTHERTIFGVMIDGSFDTLIAGRRLDCRSETVWIEPRGERHLNEFGVRGAHVLAIEPYHQHADYFEPLRPMLEDVRLVQTAGVRLRAQQLARELRSSDPLAPLTIDALIMLMMVSVARLEFARQRQRGAPPWLLRVRDALHDQFAKPPSLRELAAIGDVSPAHLIHAFRKHFGLTPGEYVRHVRAHWAGQQLASTVDSIADIALAGGYCDQSHLTREMRRVFGMTPLEYRMRAAS